MKVMPTAIPEVLVIEPTIYSDSRGFFMESWNRKQFREATGINSDFVQDNHSRSVRNVLRGLHYQIKHPQGKLFSVVTGRVFDVAVDLRKHSSTFGQWVGVELSQDNHRQLWMPEGFAHGFLILSDYADCIYKTTDFYSPDFERCLKWDDQDIGIKWPLEEAPVLSEKDSKGTPFSKTEYFL